MRTWRAFIRTSTRRPRRQSERPTSPGSDLDFLVSMRLRCGSAIGDLPFRNSRSRKRENRDLTPSVLEPEQIACLDEHLPSRGRRRIAYRDEPGHGIERHAVVAVRVSHVEGCTWVDQIRQ